MIERQETTMSRSRIFSTVLLAVALALAFGARSASADTFTSILDTGNSAISGYSGPYGTVTVDRTSSTAATVTFTSNTVNSNIYLFGDGSSAAVNVNASSFTITGISGSNAGTGFSPGSFSVANPPGTSNVDGFGLFNGVIDSFDGFTHTSDTISFTLTNLSGTWASAVNVLTPNADGNDAAAHIFVTSSPAGATNGAIATGYAGETGGAVVPEPSTMALAGLGALGFLGYGLRRRSKK
jgi:hypothetical protein